MADPRKLTAFQVFISKLFGISSIGVKMLSLICYQYILVVIFYLRLLLHVSPVVHVDGFVTVNLINV